MKLISIILLCLLLCTVIAWQQQKVKKYQHDAQGIKGPVRSYTLWTYTKGLPDDAVVDSNWNYKSVITFNRSGNILAIVSSNTKNETVISYDYDELGRQIATRQNKTHLIDTAVYTINAKGNLVEHKGRPHSLSFLLVYNKDGYRDTMYVNNVLNKPTSKVIYHYKIPGRLMECGRYKADNSLDYREVYTYNKAGDQLSRMRYNAPGNVESSISYEYDKYQNLIASRDSGAYVIGSEHRPFLETKKYRYSQFDTHGNWQREDALNNGNKSYETRLRKLTYY